MSNSRDIATHASFGKIKALENWFRMNDCPAKEVYFCSEIEANRSIINYVKYISNFCRIIIYAYSVDKLQYS